MSKPKFWMRRVLHLCFDSYFKESHSLPLPLNPLHMVLYSLAKRMTEITITAVRRHAPTSQSLYMRHASLPGALSHISALKSRIDCIFFNSLCSCQKRGQLVLIGRAISLAQALLSPLYRKFRLESESCS